jgi:hypothetical protein
VPGSIPRSPACPPLPVASWAAPRAAIF